MNIKQGNYYTLDGFLVKVLYKKQSPLFQTSYKFEYEDGSTRTIENIQRHNIQLPPQKDFPEYWL